MIQKPSLKQSIIKDEKISLYDDMGSDIIARQQLKPLYYRNGAAMPCHAIVWLKINHL